MDSIDRLQKEQLAQRLAAEEEKQRKFREEREIENKELRRKAAERLADERTALNQAEALSPRLSTIPIAGTTLGGGVAAGGLGFLNNQDVILTIERPIRYQPYDYSKLIGYPTDKAVKLGSIEGFAVVSKCHLRCEATLKEQELILEHFRQGVIF